MCLPYWEEEPLGGTGLEQLLPLVRVAHGEGDGVDVVLELGRHGGRPAAQLKVQGHFSSQTFRLEPLGARKVSRSFYLPRTHTQDVQ